MTTIEVSIELPFFLRLESPFSIEYDKVCQGSQGAELLGTEVEISFFRRLADTVDRSGWLAPRSTVVIRVETTTRLSDECIDRFAVLNCMEILNKLVDSYQAVTGEVSNAGFIVRVGMSDIQL
ncbi:MAG TPA: hypothetical protein VJP78_00045, partial [Thermoleophilia bacterium]|nr:hypothetical protein [Thermoleophilia bacterium]